MRSRLGEFGEFPRQFLLAVLVLAIGLNAGCGTLRNGRGWGEDAFSQTSWTTVGRAAYRALFSWGTLVPAAGALLVDR